MLFAAPEHGVRSLDGKSYRVRAHIGGVVVGVSSVMAPLLGWPVFINTQANI